MPNLKLLELIGTCVEAGRGRTDTDAIRAADGFAQTGIRPWCKGDRSSGLLGALTTLQRAGLVTFGHTAHAATFDRQGDDPYGDVVMGPAPVFLTEAGRRALAETDCAARSDG